MPETGGSFAVKQAATLREIGTYAFCAIFEDGVDMRSWSAVGGVHDLALVGSLASLQQQIVEDRNSTEHEGPESED